MIFYLVNIIILCNFNISNAVPHNDNELQENHDNHGQNNFPELMENNIQEEPTIQNIKDIAQETIRERFKNRSTALMEYITSKNFNYDVIYPCIHKHKYEYNELSDIIDLENIKQQIAVRKEYLDNNINNLNNNIGILEGNSWNEIHLSFNKCVPYEIQKDINKRLINISFPDKFSNDHWYVLKNNDQCKFIFMLTYEFTSTQNIVQEEVLSTCLMAMELDLLNNNSFTETGKLFAKYLLNKYNTNSNTIVNELERYRRYFTATQNIRLNELIKNYYNQINTSENHAIDFADQYFN